MSEREFRKALLSGEEPIDVQAMTARVLRRDRRLIGFMGIACVIAWMLVVMLPWATVLPMLARVVEHQIQMNSSAAPTIAEQREETMRVLVIVKQGTIATFIGSVVAMAV